jgi:hypothetical protein
MIDLVQGIATHVEHLDKGLRGKAERHGTHGKVNGSARAYGDAAEPGDIGEKCVIVGHG